MGVLRLATELPSPPVAVVGFPPGRTRIGADELAPREVLADRHSAQVETVVVLECRRQ